MMGNEKWRLDGGFQVFITFQRRSGMTVMVGFVEMARKQLYGENVEIWGRLGK